MIQKLEGDDKSPIVTVAYIPAKAPDLATFLALACTEIVMYRDKDLEKKREVDPSQTYEAVLGDFENYLKGSAKGNDAGNTADSQRATRRTCQRAGYSEILVKGMIDSNEVIQEVRNTSGVTKYMSEEERKLLNDKARKQEWSVINQIKQTRQLVETRCHTCQEASFHPQYCRQQGHSARLPSL